MSALVTGVWRVAADEAVLETDRLRRLSSYGTCLMGHAAEKDIRNGAPIRLAPGWPGGHRRKDRSEVRREDGLMASVANEDGSQGNLAARIQAEIGDSARSP